jgi:hypothetical protein
MRELCGAGIGNAGVIHEQKEVALVFSQQYGRQFFSGHRLLLAMGLAFNLLLYFIPLALLLISLLGYTFSRIGRSDGRSSIGGEAVSAPV